MYIHEIKEVFTPVLCETRLALPRDTNITLSELKTEDFTNVSKNIRVYSFQPLHPTVRFSFCCTRNIHIPHTIFKTYI